MTEEQVVDLLEDGMTIGIGGWGSRRKPMSLIRAMVRSSLRDLHIVSYGGADVGLLAASGKIRHLSYAFVSLDVIALDPHFRAARQAGAFKVTEMDEGMMLLGLQAAAWRVPFLPTRVGLGTDLFLLNPDLKTVTSPYAGPSGHREELTAVPALSLDVALIHAHRADVRGNAQMLGVDPYFDQLMSDAAQRTFVSCDELVSTAELASQPHQSMLISRMAVAGVVHAPRGAHPTSCDPFYPWDEKALKAYTDSARSEDAWSSYRDTVIGDSEAHYQAAQVAS